MQYHVMITVLWWNLTVYGKVKKKFFFALSAENNSFIETIMMSTNTIKGKKKSDTCNFS